MAAARSHQGQSERWLEYLCWLLRAHETKSAWVSSSVCAHSCAVGRVSGEAWPMSKHWMNRSRRDG